MAFYKGKSAGNAAPWAKIAGFVIAGSALLAACANNDEVLGRTGPSGGSGGGSGTDGSSTGGFMSFGFPDSGTDAAGDGSSNQTTTTTVVLPDGATVLNLDGAAGGVLKLVCEAGALVVAGAPKTVACWVELEGGTRADNVVWETDDTRIGSIGSDGIFRANGFVGGEVKVTATMGTTGVRIGTVITVDVAIQDNSGGLSPTEIAALTAGGSADAQFAWLYPYDKTVFPRGLAAPVLQFQSSCTATSTYLKITLPHFLYQQAAAGSAPLRITIPDAVWNGMTLSTSGLDPVTATVSKSCAGQVSGPVTEQWLIAPGKLKGVVYYGTYRAPDFGGTTGIVRLKLGSQSEMFITSSKCTACHTVSANGGVLGTATDYTSTPVMSATFDLTTGSVPPPTIIEVKDGTAFTFSGLTPDGKQALTSSEPIRGTAGPNPSRLIDAKTAQVIPTPSLPVQYAVTPAFSPDGKHVGFTNEAAGNGHLAVMDFDGTQNPPFFSNLRDVAVNDAQVLSWPSFLPDSLAVVYTEGAGFESKNGPAALRSVNMASGAVSTLDSLNAAKSGLTAAKNFKPTVMPRPIGGYFWVMFSSNRTYGNTTVSGLKIWVAAFDLDHVGKQDASHPAFFLPGQAMNSLSLGPYVALEPCRALGATCESGVDCCDGFCRETSRAADGTPVLQCVPPPPASCSQVDEFCVTPADCCDQTNLCILNRCALPPPPPIF